MDKVIEKWVSKINELTIGATKEEGGTRSKKVKVGGESTVPFLFSEGEMPNPPAIALEVWDTPPEEWIYLTDSLKDVINDPILWLKRAEAVNPDLICFRLASCHPDIKNNSADYAGELIRKILNNTSLPLIIIGCGHSEKDADILLSAAEASKGEKVLLGMATKDNYKTITATAISCGHNIIAESPLDINLAKQLNILISDMGLPLERIVMHPTTGGLGYGFEYCYTIMERTRLAGLQGDKIMATPIINMVAQETWKTKEAKATDQEQPSWGTLDKRALAWEISCATGYLQSGSNILVVAHPESVRILKRTIAKLMQK
jgi:acetyl-CoA decarbonylase/synthase complex subunit delta